MTDIESLALTGGIGGCKLALGLQHIVAAGRLACIVNTGDEFRHLGLHVAPELDTALYTLAGLNDPQRAAEPVCEPVPAISSASPCANCPGGSVTSRPA